ncbi:MAG: cytochrome C', partial [Burkholderiales bacterium]|nr:cytochrome C' [Burkholderiales bacterium]
MRLAAPLSLGLSALLAAAPASAAPELVQSKICLSCHAVDHKIIGPAFKDVAARYAGRGDAAAYLAAKILHGGSGVWGAVPMPANTNLSPQEALELARWVLAQGA